MNVCVCVSYHAGFFVEIDADGPDAVERHGHQHDQYLHRSDPVCEVRSMISGVAAQLPLPVGLWRVSSGSLSGPGRGHPAHDAHAVLPPVRVVEGRVQQPVPNAGSADVRTHSGHPAAARGRRVRRRPGGRPAAPGDIGVVVRRTRAG